MAEFAYNNTKNTNTSHTPFELNFGYHPKIFFVDDINPRSKSRFANKLVEELTELIEVCYQNLLHIQELQKRVYDKGVKSCNYTLSKKVLLNSKYIKTKWNKKLENKFFGPFQVSHTVEKQVYKLELPTK